MLIIIKYRLLLFKFTSKNLWIHFLFLNLIMNKLSPQEFDFELVIMNYITFYLY